MNERDMIVWMAGFFDGEGTVSIGRNRRITPNRRPIFSYRLSIIIAQKVPEPLIRFKELFGGTFFHYKRKGATYHRWALGGDKAQAVLEKLLPYLLVKRAVAEVGIRFQIQMTEWNKQCGRTGYPEEIVLGRDVFYQEARALNEKSRTNLRAPLYEGPRATKASG